ncbi:MAG TPA: GspH/FimT family pseudopilin [Casimicrobiaceae bacterium]|jgi:type IV fimbrial biogenesis protein FimT
MNRSESLLRATGWAHPRKFAAFTLIELMIALALAGILAATAAPNWRAFLAASELRERSEALMRALSVARSEAIKRGTRVDLCPSVDRLRCASSANWEIGWLTFINEANAAQPASGGAILSREVPAATGITIAGNRPVADYISFTSLGHARRHDGALQMGTFTICRRGQDARKVVLANSGRTRLDVTKEACP